MKGWLRAVPGFLMGVGIGTAVALFVAPRSGQKTRRLLKEKAQDGIKDAVARGKKAVSRAQRAVDEAREFANDARETGKTTLRDTARTS